MKVLFVASNPANESGLSLEAEITALQATFMNVPGEPVQFIAQPQAMVENLTFLIAQHKPDVLHITAHGSGEQLAMRNAVGDKRQITAEMLGGFLAGHRPKLIYLNACNSHDVARGLREWTDLAIGSSEPIINRAANAGALSFYSLIVQGYTVGQAFRAAAKSVAAMQSKPVLEIEAAYGVRPDELVLHQLPTLVAEITNDDLRRRRKSWRVRFGLLGCPKDTVQIVFFTDESEQISNHEDPSKDLCMVHRKLPRNGVGWCDLDATWPVDGDWRMFAVGVTSGGHTFSVGSSVTEALERHLDKLPEERKELVMPIIRQLRG